jgi:tRNA(Leu) C34 or U34 (ribose-2'-O)-methylase TrmL
LTINQHNNIHDIINNLKSDGYKILTTDVNINSMSIYNYPWYKYNNNNNINNQMFYNSDKINTISINNNDSISNNNKDIHNSVNNLDNRKLVIVIGNEERGVSEDMKSLADTNIYIPMNGFAESLNLSVAVGNIFYYLYIYISYIK